MLNRFKTRLRDRQRRKDKEQLTERKNRSVNSDDDDDNLDVTTIDDNENVIAKEKLEERVKTPSLEVEVDPTPLPSVHEEVSDETTKYIKMGPYRMPLFMLIAVVILVLYIILQGVAIFTDNWAVHKTTDSKSGLFRARVANGDFNFFHVAAPLSSNTFVTLKNEHSQRYVNIVQYIMAFNFAAAIFLLIFIPIFSLFVLGKREYFRNHLQHYVYLLVFITCMIIIQIAGIVIWSQFFPKDTYDLGFSFIVACIAVVFLLVVLILIILAMMGKIRDTGSLIANSIIKDQYKPILSFLITTAVIALIISLVLFLLSYFTPEWAAQELVAYGGLWKECGTHFIYLSAPYPTAFCSKLTSNANGWLLACQVLFSVVLVLMVLLLIGTFVAQWSIFQRIARIRLIKICIILTIVTIVFQTIALLIYGDAVTKTDNRIDINSSADPFNFDLKLSWGYALMVIVDLILLFILILLLLEYVRQQAKIAATKFTKFREKVEKYKSYKADKARREYEQHRREYEEERRRLQEEDNRFHNNIRNAPVMVTIHPSGLILNQNNDQYNESYDDNYRDNDFPNVNMNGSSSYYNQRSIHDDDYSHEHEHEHETSIIEPRVVPTIPSVPVVPTVSPIRSLSPEINVQHISPDYGTTIDNSPLPPKSRQASYGNTHSIGSPIIPEERELVDSPNITQTSSLKGDDNIVEEKEDIIDSPIVSEKSRKSNTSNKTKSSQLSQNGTSPPPNIPRPPSGTPPPAQPPPPPPSGSPPKI
ncbi:hypothetical protein SNEBB_006243 [Seison nebaliae]|nr:hypothetical protein SNEBB_006243 [Seison nebaliae]